MNRLLRLAGLAVLIFASAPVRAQEDQYVQVYNLIQEADASVTSEQSIQALNKYLRAQTELQKFQKLYPAWSTHIVNFRLNYLAAKIAGLSGKAALAPPAPPAPAKPQPTPAPAPTPVAPPVTGDIQGQLNMLQDQLKQLQSDNTLLQAKVREAFSAQPAAMDPRELAKAGEKIKSLQKENDLLKVTLTQEKSAKPAAEPREVERLKQQLAEANRKLNDQLQFATQLQAVKSSLQKRVTELSADADADAALRAENVLLKKQFADLKLTASAGGDTSRKLVEAQAQIAALQSDKEILRLEKLSLRQQIKQLTLANVTFTRVAAAPEDAARTKQLERERDALQKRLASAQEELSNRRSRAVTAQVDDLRSQLEVFRTRLAVFQAPAVPFTKDELALFNKPEHMAVAVNPGFEKKSAKELPSGTVSLISEAQREFALGRYEQAEAKYLQVLKQDEKNVYTLANLAAIQLESGRLDEAGQHITQALALTPEDSYSLSILGNLKFRQGKFDEALDALGHAAKLDPKNAEVQNHLGLVLSQKGMRKEAENALRKSVELDPNYASAHNNLAVVYITQKPPAPALARWHYEKARALGMPANAQLEKMFGTGPTTQP